MKRNIELDKLWDKAEGKADQLIYGGDELIENIISEFITDDERNKMHNYIIVSSNGATLLLKALLLDVFRRAKKYKTRDIYEKMRKEND